MKDAEKDIAWTVAKNATMASGWLMGFAGGQMSRVPDVGLFGWRTNDGVKVELYLSAESSEYASELANRAIESFEAYRRLTESAKPLP